MWRRMPCWCSPPAYLPPPPPLPTPTLQLPAAEASSDDLLQSLNQKAERTEQWVKILFGDKNMKTATARLAMSKPKAEAARIKRERQLQQQQAEAVRMAKKKATAFKCRRCPEAFASNTKLHDHVRTKHTKKSTPPTPPASFRPASLTIIQKRLPTAPPSGQHMRFRQMRIASYFKSFSNRPTHQPPTSAMSKVMLVSNMKHADSRTHGKSAGNRNLVSFSPAFASHPAYRTCCRCSQVFTSRNLLHRHLGHCISGTTGYGTPRLGIAHCK